MLKARIERANNGFAVWIEQENETTRWEVLDVFSEEEHGGSIVEAFSDMAFYLAEYFGATEDDVRGKDPKRLSIGWRRKR